MKKQFATAKHAFLAKIKADLSSIKTGNLQRAMSKREKAAYNQTLSKSQKSTGFHTFCASKSVQDLLPELLLNRAKEKKTTADIKGTPYLSEDTFSALHTIKSQLWNELSKAEKVEWKERALKLAHPEVELDP